MDQELVSEYKERYEEVKDPQTSKDWEEYNRLSPIITEIKKLEKTQQDISETKKLIESSQESSEMTQLAKDELMNLKSKLEKIHKNIDKLVKEEEEELPENKKNAIMEIRPGAGGEEASLFAGDLFRMYSMYAQNNSYKIEIMDQSLSDTGGIKLVIAKFEGKKAYGKLKYESGVHRVQRVPATESSGRIHTSTASVAVLPEADEVDVEIKPEDLEITATTATGAGGQHVNKRQSAVRVIHKPTGIEVYCQENRSQIKNRKAAMSILRSKLYEKKLREEQEKRANKRRNQIGHAMRAEKIRTYNFPQNRVTDHRLKKSWYNIESIMDGEIEDIIQAFKNPEEDEEN